MAGGPFAFIGGQTRNDFARLSNATAALQNLAVTQTAVTWTRGGSSPQFTRTTFESSTDNVNYTPLGNGTVTVTFDGSIWTLTGLNLTTGQNIYVRARGYYRSGYYNGSESITESVRNAFLIAGPTATATSTPTNTATATLTNTPTLTPTNTSTNTPTDTPTNTATPTFTPTFTPTNTPTSTPTPASCTVVTNTNDSGSGSLRNAITCANTTGGVDTISFSIPGAGAHTITPATVLPTITDPVIIDGYTQPGASVNTLAAGNNANLLIELNGTTISNSLGLHITSGGSTVRGLVINRFGTQIQLDSVGGNTIAGNFIGTDPSGTAWATLGSGVLSGIVANSGSNQFGGTTAAARNVIVAGSNFFSSHAIEINGSGSIVQGNYIGTNKDGTARLGNTGRGVFLANASGSNNTIGGTTGTTPGGACTGACNLISGTNEGIESNGSGSNTVIQGNFIGTNATGTAAITGSNTGIRFSFLSAGTGHLIGGTTASARNVISGNGGGIQMEGSTVTIQGNYIGVATNGTSALGNAGASLYLQANNTTVGGISTGAGNVIAYSGGLGLQVVGSGISIRGNSIYSNSNLGIDLGSDNVTANDDKDPDTGPNNLQNYPVVTNAAIGSTTVGGTLNSTPGQSFSIDVYSNTACDPSGHGEGRTYLGTATNVITDGTTGNASFTVTVPAIAAGQIITATATDAGGNTSEFSLCFTSAVSTPTATNTSTPTPTPTDTPSISGTVTYGNAAAPPKYISNATVNGTGSPNVFTTTAAPGGTAGQYTLTGFGSGSYTVSLTKTTGVNSITSNDAARIAQHVAGTLLLTTDNQRVTADVTNNGSISSTDAAQIARFVASLGPPIGLTGQWRFFLPPGPTFPVGSSPTSRTYSSVTSNIVGDDYVGLLIGEVTGNWIPSAARPDGAGAAESDLDASRKDEAFPLIGGQSPEIQGPERDIAIDLPSVLGTVNKEIIVPVNVQRVADKEIISYEFDLRYDPSVIQPLVEPIDVAGTVSRGLSFVTNAVEPGLLRVVVYGAFPIDSDGVLFNLRFTAVGAGGSVSPLVFERIMFNEGEPSVALKDGRVEIQR
ncbi:MAG: cohesin domain-containing protein [Pyrinomonadaceae bacterium]